MYKPFFPNPGFAWSFLALLVALGAAAAFIDSRKRVIPKWLTLSTLAIGIIVNVIRGAWLGARDSDLWLLETGSAWLGGLDGLLFALIGCLAGFFILFILWVMGTCGGGDVKLFAALGGWVGPSTIVFVLAASLVVLVATFFVKVLTGGVSVQAVQGTIKAAQKKKGGAGQSGKASKWRVTYSLSAAVATVIVLLWIFRVELQLAAPKPQGNTKAEAHARS